MSCKTPLSSAPPSVSAHLFTKKQTYTPMPTRIRTYALRRYPNCQANHRRPPFSMRKVTYRKVKGRLLQTKRRPFTTHWVSTRYNTPYSKHGRRASARLKSATLQPSRTVQQPRNQLTNAPQHDAQRNATLQTAALKRRTPKSEMFSTFG